MSFLKLELALFGVMANATRFICKYINNIRKTFARGKFWRIDSFSTAFWMSLSLSHLVLRLILFSTEFNNAFFLNLGFVCLTAVSSAPK